MNFFQFSVIKPLVLDLDPDADPHSIKGGSETLPVRNIIFPLEGSVLQVPGAHRTAKRILLNVASS